MAEQAFSYHVVYKRDKGQGPANLIAALILADRPLRAVLWSHPDQDWIYAPGTAARTIYDDQLFDRVFPVDRPTAEQLARQSLGVDLPTEARLLEICEEGNRLGLT